MYQMFFPDIKNGRNQAAPDGVLHSMRSVGLLVPVSQIFLRFKEVNIMPRLREVNPKLDNQLKSINSKILAAARVSTDSETYRKLAAQVKMIAKATNQENLTTKTVNGKAIPQLSRANSYYSGLKAMNRMAVESAADSVKQLSITAEMKRFAQASGTGYAKTNAFKKEFKNVLEQQAFQRKKDKLMSGDSEIADLLSDLPAGTETAAFSEQMHEYMFSEYYNEREFMNQLDSWMEKMDEDIQSYSSRTDALKRDIDAATDSEKIQALRDDLHEAETILDQLHNKRDDLGVYMQGRLALETYKGVTSKYYMR